MSEEASINVAALAQRVLGLESNLASNQRSFSESLQSLAHRVETLFAGLATKIEERSRPQYPLLISLGLLGLAVVSSVGWLAYAPIRENQTDLKLAVAETNKAVAALASQTAFQIAGFGERFVSTRELLRTDANVKAIEAVIVPRVEQAERMRSVDAQFVNQQRQIDDIKKAFGETFSLRDALIQMQRRIDQLEAARRSS